MKRSSNRGRPASGTHAGEPAPFLRCAIYGRVSTDEQAVLEYNSLQAQEDICKNYIGIRAMDPGMLRKWTHVETYVDTGYSGGTLDRPELKRLLADIKAGKIDVVVAYKIDRISRSISQFYEIWNLLEEHGVDFASATQEFNTATSQGKLMLNLLLSFAQYERELIGERTRDKIAAARKKGRWVGGYPVLGYDVVKKTLVVNQAEAIEARDLFDLYLEQLSVMRALSAANEKGYKTKQWTTSTGKTRGGRPYDKKALRDVLTNPIYIGKVRHHDQLFDGIHEAIVDPTKFQRVQDLMANNYAHRTSLAKGSEEAVLTGLLKCGACQRAMGPMSTRGRAGRRYSYYLCQRAQKEGSSACPAGSVSARAIEKVLFERIEYLATDEAIINRIVAKSAAEANAKLPFLREERARTNAEHKQRREEARRLVEAIAAGNATGHSLNDAIKLAEEDIANLGRRIAALDDQIDRLDRTVLTPGQVFAGLKDFVSVWKTLTTPERGRLARCVIAEIVYERRDKSESEIRWRFRALKAEKPEDQEVLGFVAWNTRRGGRDSNPRPPA